MVSLTFVCLVSCVFSGAFTQTASDIPTLTKSILSLASNIDTNGDGQLSIPERIVDFRDNFDTNNDGCVDEKEFVKRYTAMNFTAVYSNFIFWATITESGDLDNPVCVGFNVTNPRPTNTNFVLNLNIFGLTNWCESDPARYVSNSECNQLPRACSLPTLGCFYGCFNYTLNIASQHLGPTIALPVLSQFQQQMTFEQAFDNLITSNDQNGDGVITPAEFAKDVAIYDANKDGCIDQLEFTARWMFVRCGGLGLSREFAEERFSFLVPFVGGPFPNCNGIPTNSFQRDFPTDPFINSQIQTLIKTCEADRSRYQTVKDCNQLLDFCVYSPKYSAYDGCKTYINGVIKGIYGFAF
ncbi:uncharacterized protein LOC118477205 [Aplysia californica]|uniref:Uncharacterized protein LOC118477205 n=1 Tax=Aplysia californica TaxID=6500 RepID=A0ABM1W3M0_APLCA|nr:uncharacterized protein LOC118477205 [Aplysia californica]